MHAQHATGTSQKVYYFSTKNPRCVLSNHIASTCRTKPTETLCVRTIIDTKSHRNITRKELHVEKQTLGRGMFGRCYLAYLGPLQIFVCESVSTTKQCVSTFTMDATFLLKFCHENIH